MENHICREFIEKFKKCKNISCLHEMQKIISTNYMLNESMTFILQNILSYRCCKNIEIIQKFKCKLNTLINTKIELQKNYIFLLNHGAILDIDDIIKYRNCLTIDTIEKFLSKIEKDTILNIKYNILVDCLDTPELINLLLNKYQYPTNTTFEDRFPLEIAIHFHKDYFYRVDDNRHFNPTIFDINDTGDEMEYEYHKSNNIFDFTKTISLIFMAMKKRHEIHESLNRALKIPGVLQELCWLTRNSYISLLEIFIEVNNDIANYLLDDYICRDICNYLYEDNIK